jgi:hypothetical protein
VRLGSAGIRRSRRGTSFLLNLGSRRGGYFKRLGLRPHERIRTNYFNMLKKLTKTLRVVTSKNSVVSQAPQTL